MDERIYQKVKAYIEKYGMIASGDRLVAGVSGGADSVCLLLLLIRLAADIPHQIAVVHVNHGVRIDAAEDAAYVEELCAARGIPFYLINTDIRQCAKAEGISEEEAGRKVRYEAFSSVLQEIGANRIAVAHNSDDRAETMLFHLFRGTGLAGAGGIKPVRDNIIRPLLCLSRKEIEEYLCHEGVRFCIDSTNLEDTYTRNRIRHHILPFAEKEICIGAAAHMCEAADLFLEAETYIRNQTDQAYERCLIEDDQENGKIILHADILKNEDPLIRKYVLLAVLEKLTEGRKDITSAHIASLTKLTEKSGTKQISLPYGLKAVIEYGKLRIQTVQQIEQGEITKSDIILPVIPGVVYVPGLGEVEITIFSYEKNQIIPEKSYTKWFDYDRITTSLVFRTRKTGDFLTINNNLSKKSLKEYMIDEKIPKNERNSFYILAQDSHVLWIPGYRISQYYKVSENTKRILQVRLRGEL